jgi:hypothetical protein
MSLKRVNLCGMTDILARASLVCDFFIYLKYSKKLFFVYCRLYQQFSNFSLGLLKFLVLDLMQLKYE